MPKPFTENEKKWIQEKLLEQGRIQFSTYGLKKTSIEGLAQAASISKAAFYIFYESKEALFMDVVEQAEERYRLEVLASIDQPGPSPRARFVKVLKTSFTHWKSDPLLRFFTSSDFDILVRRVSPEMIEEHVESDRRFLEALIAGCREAGIPIQVDAERISGLMYALFFMVLHEDDMGPYRMGDPIDVMLELVAAFCLGEVQVGI